MYELILFIIICVSFHIVFSSSDSSINSSIAEQILDSNTQPNTPNTPNVLNSNDSYQARMVPDKEEDEEITSPSKSDIKRVVNFASLGAGAVVLESSDKAKGYSNLLNEDKDKYGISPCSEKKWVVIGLSEDIMVHTVVIANYEKYRYFLYTSMLIQSRNK